MVEPRQEFPSVFELAVAPRRSLCEINGELHYLWPAVDHEGEVLEIRTLSSGRLKGGTPFSFRHIYYILTNPIYAGRIRHKASVYPGLHPSLIEPEHWDIRKHTPTELDTIGCEGGFCISQ